jgi:hypothetical protein
MVVFDCGSLIKENIYTVVFVFDRDSLVKVNTAMGVFDYK